MYLSVFDIFKIGIGPSSSHTMGPMTAASRFLDTLRKCTKPERVSVTLHGSLAFTGKGHATDRAVVLGLMGLLPDTLDPDDAEQLQADVRHSKRISPDGLGGISFDPEKDLAFDYGPALPGHANALVFRAYDTNNKRYLEETYYSIGGGFVVNDSELADLSHDKPQDFADEKRDQGYPYPFGTAAQMLEMGRRSNLSIAQMKRANEIAHSSEKTLVTRLKQINKAMNDCIDRGLRKDGELPGGLKVKRRARAIHEQLLAERGTNMLQPHAESDFLSVYAMAVNEENAAGGRVVTSPTNGAAGVIPAVLRYYRDHCKGANSDGENDLLLTASVIGGLIKHNASISGAEVGCQGEVGSASAMAAAGLCAALGGSNEQIENAAEIALEHHLGMTCDPAAGLVQVPCIERNAMGAIKAVSAASLALRGDGTHFMPLDNCIETMRQTGIDMNHKYKETSLGGIAVNLPACCLAIGLIGAALLATAPPAKAESAICQDITRSIILSQSGFESLHDGSKNSGNSFIVTEPLFAAPKCEVLPNASAHSLRCSWSFAYDDALAEEHYDYLLSVVPECLGSDVAVSEDQPVNHPDTYKSHIYQLAAAELRVTLKNKYAMKKKFVSMIIEGRNP